jgi:hypothetical protein
VADKSLAVEFKNPWNLLADFNSDLSNTHARQREKSEKSNWRREGDSNPRYLLGMHAFQACALNHSAISPPEKTLWPSAPHFSIQISAPVWRERLPQLLDLPAPLEAVPVAAVVSSAAAAEPDYAI